MSTDRRRFAVAATVDGSVQRLAHEEGSLTTLLVASAGGHLEQLLQLRPRLEVDTDITWVTYEVPPARNRLANEQVVGAYHPTTKNVPNAVRNYRLARRVFAEHETDQVISTGAAVAVPFMVRARQLDIPCHYIESATRVDGPSLSGRILQRLRGVHLYRQLGDWGSPRWKAGPCVFDGYATGERPTGQIGRVVVSLGTHDFAFDAAVARLSELFRDLDVDVLWQLGSTPDPGGLPGRVVSRLPAHELQEAIEEADVVVGHAGVGLSLTALYAGKVPVLLPRRRRRHEHTDDHQVQLARELHRRGLAISTEVEELSLEYLERAGSRKTVYERPEPFHLVD